MSVYEHDKPEHLRKALDSVVCSVVKPDEVCIVFDGYVIEENVNLISSFMSNLSIKTVKLDENVGLGRALNIGLSFCSNELIARFDSDDICHPLRFKKQMDFFKSNPQVDIVGTWIAEFDHDHKFIHALRRPPTTHQDIIRYAKNRNPFNHMTVMYRKSKVLEAGSYQDNYLYEDYALWVRMINNGAVTANIPEALVYARTGNGMEIRRGGFKYAYSECSAQISFYKSGFISELQLCKNLLVRVPVRLLPGDIRKSVYRNFLRK
ncbi:glycosyltransferase [Escherichia coli]|nr:glycosyltransferase [Plesiomonas shigelloides]QSF76803.1 glycosyltransferase [Escherichia coli]HCW2765237.1 glycosyltransferase [Escherichia coli]